MLDRALGVSQTRASGPAPAWEQLLQSQLRIEASLARLADVLASKQARTSLLDREAQHLFAPGVSLEGVFQPQLVSNVLAVGRVTVAGGFFLRDDTKVFSEEIVGKTVLITSGPGAGERKAICGIGETPNILRFLRSFRSRPSADSTYVILEGSTYNAMFESSRTWTGITATVVNDGNQNSRWPFFINPGAQGVILHVNIANLAAGGRWSPRIEIRDFLNNAIEIFRAQHWLDRNGDFYYLVHPQATSPNYRGMTESVQGPLTIGGWQVRMVPEAAISADVYFDAQYM